MAPAVSNPRPFKPRARRRTALTCGQTQPWVVKRCTAAVSPTVMSVSPALPATVVRTPFFCFCVFLVWSFFCCCCSSSSVSLPTPRSCVAICSMSPLFLHVHVDVRLCAGLCGFVLRFQAGAPPLAHVTLVTLVAPWWACVQPETTTRRRGDGALARTRARRFRRAKAAQTTPPAVRFVCCFALLCFALCPH